MIAPEMNYQSVADPLFASLPRAAILRSVRLTFVCPPPQVDIAAALGAGRSDADLLAAVRSRLAGWRDSEQLGEELRRATRLYSAPGG